MGDFGALALALPGWQDRSEKVLASRYIQLLSAVPIRLLVGGEAGIDHSFAPCLRKSSTTSVWPIKMSWSPFSNDVSEP